MHVNRRGIKEAILQCLKIARDSNQQLSYSEIIEFSDVDNNLYTRNILSFAVRDGLVRHSGYPNYYKYSITELGLEYLNLQNQQKLRKLLSLVV